MSKTIFAVVDCTQLWDKPRKVRLKNSAAASSSSTHTPRSSPSPTAIKQQIFQYIVNNRNDRHAQQNQDLQESDVLIDIYHPDGKFISLLDPSVAHNFVETFGKRLRCVVQFTNFLNKGDNCENPSEILMIKGRYFNYNPNGMEYAAGKTLTIQEEVNNQNEDGTGLNVWDGSLLLARYLERNPDTVKYKAVLELGSGPALVGIAAALLGAQDVILSDLKYTLPLMESNVRRNRNMIDEEICKRIECMEIDWFDPPDAIVLYKNKGILINSSETSKLHLHPYTYPYPQVILVADCVWLEDLVDPLMDTVERFCHPKTKVFFTYQKRGRAAHELFWKRLRGFFSYIEDVDTVSCCSLDKPELISLLHCRV